MNTRAFAVFLSLCSLLASGLAPAAEPAATKAAASETVYVVKPGDTLMSVASQLLAAGAKDYKRLASYNDLADANVIVPGTTLRIPIAWLKRQASPVRVITVAGEVKAGERVLKVGDTVSEGEEVVSAPGGFATLEFADRSVLRIRPESRVRIEAHKGTSTLAQFETRLRLGAGAVEAAVAPQRAANFRIQTPTANMAVRGTEFRVQGSETASQAEVIEGRVGVAGVKGAEVAVNAGFGTVVRQGEAPATPVKLLGAPDLSGVPEAQEGSVARIAFPALEGAAGYRVVAATDRELRNVVVETTVRRPLVRIVDLQAGEYFYGVRAVDALGLEGREAQGKFRLNAQAPAK